MTHFEMENTSNGGHHGAKMREMAHRCWCLMFCSQRNR